MATPSNRLFGPSMLIGIIATTVIAYAIHTTSWIAHEVQGGDWVRWIELTYVATLIIWVTGFALALMAWKHLRKTSPRANVGDERTNLLLLRAHQQALVIVLLAQIPFFFFEVPAHVLAQLTVTTAVVSLFGSYVWLDR